MTISDLYVIVVVSTTAAAAAANERPRVHVVHIIIHTIRQLLQDYWTSD